jgi:hypothetical protein
VATPVVGPDNPTVVNNAQLQRPARTLLGWMTQEEAILVQNGRRTGDAAAVYSVRAQAARDAVAGRPVGVDQTDIVSAMPSELESYVNALQQPAALFFNEGWTVGIVDLRRVCAVQPNVFTDHTEQRTASGNPNDLQSLAHITLPIPTNAEIPAQFDKARQTWMINSANPNLRIVGNWAGHVQPGVVGLGFTVAITPSFVQVARLQNRYVLRDGYHRAYGLLRRGISFVPVFVRDFGFQELGLPSGMLPQTAYLGERPPLLSDYLDDSVSSDVMLPATQKMIVINGMELTPLG